MILQASEHEVMSPRQVLRQRCWALGLPTLRCDTAGATLEDERAPTELFSPLVDQWTRSRLLSRLLASAARQWADDDMPGAAELYPGCWAIPLPEFHRRRRAAYLVALALEPRALQGEHFLAACQSARLDAEATRTGLARCAAFDADSVMRTALMLVWAHQDRTEIGSSAGAIASFSQQLSESYEEISLLHKLGRSMTELVQPENFVSLMCDELHATLAFGWIAVVFDDDVTAVRGMAGQRIVGGDAGMPEHRLHALLDDVLRHVRSPAAAVVAPASLSPDAEGLLRANLLVHPVFRDDRLIAAIVAGEKASEDGEISSVDMKLVDAAAHYLTILLDNSALYEEQRRMFLGTLEALSASIDAKDRYTCGHSERVAQLSMQLAEALGMDEDAAERVRICGMVHDVGKIGVPEAVLCKPGRLTDEEFELIKAHPAIGHRILKDIPQLEDVLPGVLHHHERWDGRGYPHGLAGDGIPLLARILALADSFDAMSSTRKYRSALPREKVLEEIRNCAGSQFDPALAPLFVTLDLTVYDEMVARHKALDDPDAPGRDDQRGAGGAGPAVGVAA